MKDILTERIINLLDNSDMSYSQFAKLLDITKSTISEWKAGRQSPLRHIIKIAQIFNISSDYLLGLNDDKTSLTNFENFTNTLDELNVKNDEELIQMIIKINNLTIEQKELVRQLINSLENKR